MPNQAEVLFYAFLVANMGRSVAELDEWAAKVLLEEPRRRELGQDWTPPADAWWRAKATRPAAAFLPLRVAIWESTWPEPALDRVGAAMQRWRRAGRCDGLGHAELYRQLRQDDRKVLGPKNSKGHTRPRFEHAVVEVAALVRRHGAELRREGSSDAPPGMSMQEELALAQKVAQKKTAECEAAKQGETRARDCAKKSKARSAAIRAAVGKVRKAERAAAAVKVKKVKEEANCAAKRKCEAKLEAAVKRKVAKTVADGSERLEVMRKQLQKARARARDKEDSAALSQKRLKRAKLAEKAVLALQTELDEMAESESDDESEEEEEAPATVQHSRRDERGRFGAQDWRLRPMQWGQLARRTPPTAINANISEVLRVYAPNAVVPQPCERQLQKMRGEVTIAGECIAAFRVAGCARILSFGWDESTKWGLGLLSSNMQIVEQGSSTPVNLVPRGATLTAGGTAKQIAKEIDEKIFLHLRKLLVGWKRRHEATYGEGSWAAAGGSDPECIGMHRLSERSLLQSDTCNAARATKTLVAEMAEAATREKHGISDAEWGALDSTARAAKSQARLCLASTLTARPCPVLTYSPSLPCRFSLATAMGTSATS